MVLVNSPEGQNKQPVFIGRVDRQFRRNLFSGGAMTDGGMRRWLEASVGGDSALARSCQRELIDRRTFIVLSIDVRVS